MALKVLVVSPTYNEIESISELISRLEQVRSQIADTYELSLLIVDDNSPDGTSSFVKNLAKSWVTVLDRPAKSGLGPAYIAGFAWGLAKDFDYFVEIDADLSHQPEELPRLLAGCKDGDLVLGTRWMPGGAVKNWPLSRQLISKAGTGYARLALRLRLRDITGGYRVISRKVLENIDLPSIASQGYCFQIEVALRTMQSGFTIKEVPITFVERVGGVSKMNRAIVIEALWNVTKWAVKPYKYRR